MKTNGNDKALEAYKIFPYLAWALTLGFFVFVYNLTMELQDVADDLRFQADYIQAQIEDTSSDIELSPPEIS